MKHIASFETAKKLEAAGFERPKPEIGQFWYTPNGRLYHITAISKKDILVRWHEGESWTNEIVVFEDQYQSWIYAPTATDLLEQLPDEYILSKNGNEWFCGCLNLWPDGFDGYDPKFTNKNAAEAVAEAFLSQSK